MKLDKKYDRSFPLARLEPGDGAVITVAHYRHAAASVVSEKDRKKYGSVPDGQYPAVCTANARQVKLECAAQPALSGAYNYWYGDRHACTDSIHADEPEHMKGKYLGTSEDKA